MTDTQQPSEQDADLVKWDEIRESLFNGINDVICTFVDCDELPSDTEYIDSFRTKIVSEIDDYVARRERQAKREVLERIENYAVEHAYRFSDDNGVVSLAGLTDLIEAELAALEATDE